jgi:hypothetical protein
MRLRHGKNSKIFYTKPMPIEFSNEFDKTHWVKIIRRDYDIKNYLTPGDVVELGKNKYALLFEYKDNLDGYKPLELLLSNMAMDKVFRLKDRQNITLAQNLIETWRGFHKEKILYHEFSFENMFFNKKLDVLFDYSFSACESPARVPANRINPDYTDVYYYQRKSLEMDAISNYFTMAVILFRILVGIMPYQGRLLEGVHNITRMEHFDWIRKYHHNPVFIFDKNEDLNRISSTANPERYQERWDNLPPLARGMFAAVFNTDNALRIKEPVFYTPDDWTNVL